MQQNFSNISLFLQFLPCKKDNWEFPSVLPSTIPVSHVVFALLKLSSSKLFFAQKNVPKLSAATKRWILQRVLQKNGVGITQGKCQKII
jgi:hypothetical protein